MQIPVYLLRSSLSAARRSREEYDAYRRDMSVIYEPERDAIRAAITAGATPLEKPDVSMLPEVIDRIYRVYSKRPSYDVGIEQIGMTFNSPEFMESIRRIRRE